MSTPACIFCDIVAGRAPAHIVYEDDLCLAFLAVMNPFVKDNCPRR